MEKLTSCLPRPTIWAKYSSQGIYKANKNHSNYLYDFLILGTYIEESKAITQTLDLLSD